MQNSAVLGTIVKTPLQSDMVARDIKLFLTLANPRNAWKESQICRNMPLSTEECNFALMIDNIIGNYWQLGNVL